MDHILPFAREYDMLPKTGLILCALSGGGDSVALVHFLKTNGFDVAAAHFNHHLRPTAGRDAALAQRLCRELEVPFRCGEGRVGEEPGNTEANARRARYAFLERTAAELGAVRIATAHTANDNLETFLLHLARGCGLQGLTGISPRRGGLVRPMLHTTRRGVEEYLAQHRLPFATDETNLDDTYFRNRVRHRVVPVLEGMNPRVVEGSARMMDTLREDQSCLMAQAERLAQSELSKGEVDGLPAALRHRVGLWTPAPPAPLPDLSLDGPLILTPGIPLITPRYTLLTRRVDSVPQQPATPGHFFLKPLGDMALRAREVGDFLRPPHRGGKTVKKWMIELKIPKEERNLVPVLVCGEKVLSVAGIGPDRDALAQPGQPGVEATWVLNKENPHK